MNSKFREGFEKKAFAGDELAQGVLVVAPLIGAGVGAITGGEKHPVKDGKMTNRSIGAIRGYSSGVGSALGSLVGMAGGTSVAASLSPKHRLLKAVLPLLATAIGAGAGSGAGHGIARTLGPSYSEELEAMRREKEALT